MVTVSVIMPFYNSKKYLKDSIASIINQTFIDFELILLDDGSTDFPEEIINLFSDNRIRYYKEVSNKGIVYQLNKGIELSTGRYIARMDADDIALPDRFKKQFEFLENSKNMNIDVLGTNAQKIGEEQDVIEFKNYHPKQISFLLNFCCPILHPTVMIRKSIFKKGIKYSDSYKYAEDFAFWKLVDNGKNIAILPEILLQYRIHTKQTNRSIDRFQTQINSCFATIGLSDVGFIDKIFLTKRLCRDIMKYWLNTGEIRKVSYLQRIYLKLRKHRLSIKSEFLNNWIYQ